MACHAARRLGDMNHNLAHILAIELLIGVQGVEFRAPVETSERLRRVMREIRGRVAPLGDDRYLADDIAAVKQLVMQGDIVSALGDQDLLPRLAIGNPKSSSARARCCWRSRMAEPISRRTSPRG